MYEQFDKSFHRAMDLAIEAAREVKQPYIGTEHVLLGIIKDGSLEPIFDRLRVTSAQLRAAVLQQIQPGSDLVMGKAGNFPATPRVRAILCRASFIALQCSSPLIGIDHLFLGFFGDQAAVAVQVLEKLNVTYERTAAIMGLKVPPLNRVHDAQVPEKEEAANGALSPERIGHFALLYFRWRFRVEGVLFLGPEDYRKKVEDMAEAVGTSYEEALSFVQTLARDFLKKVYPDRKELELLPLLPVGSM